MTPENFCNWLQGFVERSQQAPTQEQWERISLKLHEITKPEDGDVHKKLEEVTIERDEAFKSLKDSIQSFIDKKEVIINGLKPKDDDDYQKRKELAFERFINRHEPFNSGYARDMLNGQMPCNREGTSF